jgi:hypothetical protein
MQVEGYPPRRAQRVLMLPYDVARLGRGTVPELFRALIGWHHQTTRRSLCLLLSLESDGGGGDGSGGGSSSDDDDNNDNVLLLGDANETAVSSPRPSLYLASPPCR